MLNFQTLGRAAVALGAIGMVLPAQALAAPPAVSSPAVDVEHSVRLTDGALTGTLANAAGLPVEGALVAAYRGDARVAQAVTNAEGVYRLTLVPGSRYVVVANGAEKIVQTWDEATAPPAAHTNLTLIQAEGTLRSQDVCGCPPAHCGGGGKLLGALALGVGAGALAIAITEAADDDEIIIIQPVSP